MSMRTRPAGGFDAFRAKAAATAVLMPRFGRWIWYPPPPMPMMMLLPVKRPKGIHRHRTDCEEILRLLSLRLCLWLKSLHARRVVLWKNRLWQRVNGGYFQQSFVNMSRVVREASAAAAVSISLQKWRPAIWWSVRVERTNYDDVSALHK